MHLFLKVSRAVLMVSMTLAPFQLPGVAQGKEHPVKYPTLYRTIQVDGLSIFYREAGPKGAPALLLLHGLPSSSLRTHRLAGRNKIRVHVRSLRRDHESLHRSARAIALHALHAGLWRSRRLSHGIGASGSDRGSNRSGRRFAQRRSGGELEDAAGRGKPRGANVVGHMWPPSSCDCSLKTSVAYVVLTSVPLGKSDDIA